MCVSCSARLQRRQKILEAVRQMKIHRPYGDLLQGQLFSASPQLFACRCLCTNNIDLCICRSSQKPRYAEESEEEETLASEDKEESEPENDSDYSVSEGLLGEIPTVGKRVVCAFRSKQYKGDPSGR